MVHRRKIYIFYKLPYIFPIIEGENEKENKKINAKRTGNF